MVLLLDSLVNYTQHGEESMRTATEMRASHSVLAPVRAVFRAVVPTLVPAAKELDEPGWQELEALVEDALAIRPPALRKELQLFLGAIEWLPVVRYGCTFSGLGEEKRNCVLRHLQDHPVERVRCGFWGLRTLALLGYYGRPEGAHSIGYVPDQRGWGVQQG